MSEWWYVLLGVALGGIGIVVWQVLYYMRRFWASCAKCGQVIGNGDRIKSEGHYYHYKCFGDEAWAEMT